MSEPIHMRANEWAKAHKSIITTALFRKLPRNSIQFADNRLSAMPSLVNMIYRANAKHVMNLRQMKPHSIDVLTVHEAEQISGSEYDTVCTPWDGNSKFIYRFL